jgi:hypothetical protein
VTSFKRPRRRRPFNGSPADTARTEQWLSQLRTDPADGATWTAEPGHMTFDGANDIGVMAIAIGPGPEPLAIGPAPLAGYRPQPAAFPALPPAPEPGPAPILAAVPVTEPAVIGDYLRLPVMWCEMPPCISFHRDPASLGERDARGRAIADGWRYDALGRFACPGCQQADPAFRTLRPVAWQHKEVPRRWHERGTLPSAETQFRLGVEAEYARIVSYENPSLARAMIDATRRTAAS